MLSPIIPGCTRSLDAAIADERFLHAAERLDFHAHFPFTPVEEIERILRRKGRRDDPDELRSRQEVVLELLEAQRKRPHRLWALLLLVAFERDLLRLRRSLSPAPFVALDHLVVETFLATVEDLPYALDGDELRAHVLRAWGRKLRKAVRARPLPRKTPVARRAA